MAINLLPIELAPKGSAIKIAEYLKTIITIFAVIFLLFSLTLVAVFVINLIQIKNLETSNKMLKDKIGSLETVEQKLFLVKDRLSYAKEISTFFSGQKSLEQMSNVIAGLPSDLVFSQAQVSRDNFTLTLSTPSSSSLVTFMSSIVASPDFSKVSLTSFTFTPNKGYNTQILFLQ